MPSPAFKWRTYDVGVPAGSPFRGLAPETPSGHAAAAEDIDERTMALPLPVLDAWPTALDKARILLESAAEIEHALMVQYLYSAYSLKNERELSDQDHRAAVRAWRGVLLAIAREEMGHLMSVQNMLMLFRLPPNFEREDFPPRKDIYPFKLHLQPASQVSLAKYVVAESPVDATGIDDIKAKAEMEAGATINHVGILYGLLGLIFARSDQVDSGGSGSVTWDVMVRQIRDAAYKQDPDPAAWHLPDEVFDSESIGQQGDPEDWDLGELRVHRLTGREDARHAIRDIGEQGEGPTSSGQKSHFERFLGIYRGTGTVPFPQPGEWVPTRNVPTDPKPSDITDARTKRWVELADIRYGLLLGFLEHYLVSTGDHRRIFVAWTFGEMRSRLAYIANKLTGMAHGRPDTVAAIPFTLPAVVHLPGAEVERWRLHKSRTDSAIRKIVEMQDADAEDRADKFLTQLLASDRARLPLMESSMSSPSVTISFARDLQALFRPVDIDHMNRFGSEPFDLSNYEDLKRRLRSTPDSEGIVERLESHSMPPPSSGQFWTRGQIALLTKWEGDGFPE